MKKIRLFVIYIFVLAASFFVMNGCKEHKDKHDYLQKVLDNVSQIKTATYITTSSAYLPHDTIPVYINNHSYKEFVNPSDSFVGASYVRFRNEDPTRMDFAYDGKMRALINEDQKRLVIDSFKIKIIPGPYRPVEAPFFTRARTILNYILTTKDSLLIETNDFKDSIQYNFTIYDTVVEFIGNRVKYFSPLNNSNKGEVSRYEMWINKSDDLPYRIIRNMPNGKSIVVCSNVELNTLNSKNFNAADYFQSDYTVSAYRIGKNPQKNELVGKVAPEWMLKDGDNNFVALKDLKSKILLIKFTGIGCGPCHASIPFLKELVSEFKNKDFELVSLETWSSNISALKRYGNKNELNYKFLLSTKDITKSYQVQSVPLFLLLDENRVIKRVFDGYGKGTTDKQIREAIKEMM